jgi:hypothetical protein
MAGDWIKVEVALPDKPEVWQMAGILGVDPDLVVGKLLKVWRWFDAHTESGNAVGVTYALVDSLTSVTGFAEAMVFVGWLEQRDRSLCLPHFDRHNGKTSKDRALTAKRVAKSKAKGNGQVTLAPLPNALPREEKRREEEKQGAAPEFVLPDWLPAEVWQDWHKFRNGAKGWTAKARELSLASLSKLHAAGHSPRAVVDQSIERGWTGLFPVKGDFGSPSRKPPPRLKELA